MSEQVLYEPRKLYETTLKTQFHVNAEKYYEEVAGKVGLDKGANASHVRAYQKAAEEVEIAKKALGKAKAAKGWMTFLFILCYVAAVALIVIGAINASSMWYFILIGVAVALLGVFFTFLTFKKFRGKVKSAKEELEKLETAAKEKLDVCYGDMAAFNATLDDTAPQQIMEMTTPIIDLDNTFTPARLSYLMNAFALPEETNPNVSVEGIISGQIQGNPFILEKVLSHEIYDKVYRGELTITWTTTHRDSEGKTYTQTHTQTLVAETTHPAPRYEHNTRLIFGSEVAPDLTFSRSPSGISGKDEKDQEKFVKKRIKELDKQEEKAIKEGGTFQKLGNDEFDALFGAKDRNNEVQFRTMFTALAQRNLVDLIKNPEPYGDDFFMVKDHMLTSVASYHSQSFDYSPDISYFYDYSFESGKKKFVAYCDAFIKGLFFDLAPILSIPLYQLHKPKEYIYGNDYPTHITSFEHEVLANRMAKSNFIPKDADESLPLILKRATAAVIGDMDQVTIHSFSYKTSKQVDYVPKMGGDGRMHNVPVYWTKYDRVETTNNMAVADTGQNLSRFRHDSLEPLKKYLEGYGIYFERGLLSYPLGKKALAKDQANSVSSLFKKEGN